MNREPKPIFVTNPVTVKGLAAALGVEPLALIRELLMMSLFKNLGSELEFATAFEVSVRLGFQITEIRDDDQLLS